MRRHVLHISAALITFTVGFLTAGTQGNLAYALPLALAVFIFAPFFERFRVPTFDCHKLKVAVLTLLLWIPLLIIFMPLLIPQSGLGNCEPDIPEEEFTARPGALPLQLE